MNNVTIFLPVSRKENVKMLFDRLELMDCERDRTNLLVVVDGDEKLFVEARNFTELSKFNERLCVHYKAKNVLRKFDLLGRRIRIADIHNFSKEFIQEADFVFGLEDDTVFPLNALKNLIKDYGRFPYAGMITGVQIGRWGVTYIGAWKVDDVYEPTQIESLRPGKGLEEIDAGGFYCYLTKKDNYVNHNYRTFGPLGPDVDYGIELRRQGMINYIDWGIETVHRGKGKDFSVNNTLIKVAVLTKGEKRWVQSNRV